MVAAMLVLGELKGSQEYHLALRQGHVEVWASENLASVIKEGNFAGDVATVSHNDMNDGVDGRLTSTFIL